MVMALFGLWIGVKLLVYLYFLALRCMGKVRWRGKGGEEGGRRELHEVRPPTARRVHPPQRLLGMPHASDSFC